VTLPMSSGVQVALTVRSVVPDLPVVLTSGYSVSSWTDRDASDLDLLGSKSVIVMQKPNPPKRLLSALDELIGTKQTEKARTAGLSAYG
jgi:hypothetical protein